MTCQSFYIQWHHLACFSTTRTRRTLTSVADDNTGLTVNSEERAQGEHCDRGSGNYRTADRGVTCESRVCTFGPSRPAWKTNMCRTNHHRPSDSPQRARTPRRHPPSSATALPYGGCRETVTFAARVITVRVL